MASIKLSRESVKWLLLEGAAIVASILLAFAIDAWWQNRQERIQETEYLVALLAEIDDILSRIEITTAKNSEANDAARYNVNLLRSEPGVPDDLSERIWREWGTAWTTGENLDTYTELLSSGSVRILRDPDVRRSLAKLRAEMDFEQQGFIWIVELGMQWTPMLQNAIKASDAESLGNMEEFLILWREWHNDEKNDVRESALEARRTIAAALDPYFDEAE